MAMMDIIEFFDETGEEMVHRIPEQGSAETKFGSQLIVRENQAAVFFRDGKGLDVLGPGRHTLSTQNIPFLTKVLSKVTGFGGDSPFRVEVIFVNMKVYTNMKWGTREPVAFRDSELGLVRLRAFGNFTMKISEPLKLVSTLVGTMGRYTTNDVEGYLRDIIISRLNDLLGEQLKTIFDLPAIYDEFGVAVKSRLRDDFDKYGLELIDFFVQSITPPEEVQKMIDERAGMGAVGDLDKFMKYQAARTMREAVDGEGGAGGGGGGLAGVGMGAGLGAGFGMMMPGMISGAMGGGAAPAAGAAGAAAGGAAAGGAATMACPACSAQIPAGSKFCGSCGEKVPQAAACPGCGTEAPPGAKFCANCGANLAAASKCPKCQGDLAPGAKFCTNCGEKME